MGFERDSGAPNTRTPAAESAAKRAAARRKAAPKKAAKKKAAKKKAANKARGTTATNERSGSPSGSTETKKKSFFGKMMENTGKPNKRRFQRGARMTTGERKKYDTAMKRWKKKNK